MFVFLDIVSGICWMNDASSKLHILVIFGVLDTLEANIMVFSLFFFRDEATYLGMLKHVYTFRYGSIGTCTPD